MLTRRDLLRGALTAGGTFNIATAWPGTPNLALKFAQLLNRARFTDLPPKAVEHAKMIIASTLASASPGSLIDSARIVREFHASVIVAFGGVVAAARLLRLTDGQMAH